MELWPFILLAILQTITSCPLKSNSPKNGDQSYRLPLNVIPEKYALTLETDVKTFNGSVAIQIKALENTKNITLHAAATLKIDEYLIFIMDENDREITFSSTTSDTQRQFFIIFLEEELIKDKIYKLYFYQFSAVLQKNNEGFYLAKYTDEYGIERSLATTQFESIGARRAFPCFDEPAFKAKFTVSLIRPQNYTSISNEVLVATENIGLGKHQDFYAETVQMSSYLLAFVVSPFKNISSENQRVFARPEAIEKGLADYSLSVGVRVLKAFGNYLEVNYTLAKMDQIAIPDKYFAPGAMENWGLVTYRETALLCSNKTSSVSDIQYVTTVIAHEFSHQWFGDLVTLKWWKYLWLNEGFASYFEHLGTHLIEPTWRMMDQFIIKKVQGAFGPDSLNTTQPMDYETTYPGGGAPTTVSYDKGASVIRMAEHFLTSEVFQKGLTAYLLKNKFLNVEPKNLFQSWQESVDASVSYLPTNQNVSSILTPWTTQKGYPVLNVVRDLNNHLIHFSQERFLVGFDLTSNRTIWPIPINFASRRENFKTTTPDYWLLQKAATCKDVHKPKTWLIVNKQQTGYYRVNYDLNNWRIIISSLINDNIEEINVLNRAQLIDDSFQLAKSGRLNYEIPLNLSKYISKETDFIPLKSFSNNMKFLNAMFAFTDDYKLFQNYAVTLLNPVINKLGFANKLEDTHVDRLNREEILSYLCTMGSNICMKKAEQAFKDWKMRSVNISPDFQRTAFCGAFKSIKIDDFEYVNEYFEKSKDDNVRKRILEALSCSKNKEVIQKFLEKVLDGNNNLSSVQESRIFCSVSNSGKLGLGLVIKFIDEHFETLRNRNYMSDVLNQIGTTSTTKQYLNQIEEIASKHNESDGMFKQAISNIRRNIEWSEKYLPDVQKWLRSNINNPII